MPQHSGGDLVVVAELRPCLDNLLARNWPCLVPVRFFRTSAERQSCCRHCHCPKSNSYLSLGWPVFENSSRLIFVVSALVSGTVKHGCLV